MAVYQALITLDPWTFLAQVCNLLIQMIIFKKLLLEPVKKILAERSERAGSEIAEAQKARAEADAMKAEYEKSMAAARAEAGAIVAAAQKTATASAEQILADAREQATRIKQKAEADVAQEKKKAVNELKDEIGGIAVQIASRVVEREIHEADHVALIDSFIDSMQNVG